ncbi:MAG: sigma 54-interacting transcriptional regulator, partial [bacterium]
IRERYPAIRTIIITVHAATAPVAVEAIRAGAFDYLVMSRTFPDDLRSVVSKAIQEIEKEETTSGKAQEPLFGEIIGRSPGILAAADGLKKALSSSRTTVLIEGEPGTGKEFFAKILHAKDPHRCSHAFIPVKCGAMAEDVLVRELFGVGENVGGHSETPGVFAVADGGTVFLDEIDKAGPSVRVALLRLLDEGVFNRVGEVQPRSTDVRVVLAVGKGFSERIAGDSFRQDLIRRLEIQIIQLPPLKDRREDLELLVGHFLTNFAEEMERDCRELSPEALAVLQKESWPDNVRGLQAVIKHAVLFSDNATIGVEEIRKAVEAHRQTPVLSSIS